MVWDLMVGVASAGCVLAALPGLAALGCPSETWESLTATNLDISMASCLTVLLYIVQAKAAGVSQNTVNARIQALAAVPSAPVLYAQTVAAAMTAASNAFDELHAAEEPAAPVYVSIA